MPIIQTDTFTRSPAAAVYGLATSHDFLAHVLNTIELIDVFDSRPSSDGQVEYLWSYKVGAIIMDGSFRLDGTIPGQRAMYHVGGPLEATLRLDIRPMNSGSAVIMTTRYTPSSGLLSLMTSPFIHSQLAYIHEVALLEIKLMSQRDYGQLGVA